MASSTVVVDEMRSYKIDRNFVFVVENEAIGFYRTDGVLVIDIENRRFELFINATEKRFTNFEFSGFPRISLRTRSLTSAQVLVL